MTMDIVAIVAGATLAGFGFILGRLSLWGRLDAQGRTAELLVRAIRERDQEIRTLRSPQKRAANGRFVKRNKGEAL